MASMWPRRPFWASLSITGPTSVVTLDGLPTTNSAIFPLSSSMTESAMSCCKHNIRQAEQRCPAEPNADNTASFTTCSGRAVESTIIAF